jgi:hypothetical protein
MNPSPLIEFYAGRGTDFAGRRLDDIWRMSLDDLEYNHDYIQWLFPLRERSGVQPDVPVLDDTVIAAFAAPELHARLMRSAQLMAEFYGLEVVERDGTTVIRRSGLFADRSRSWLTRGNHNFLRLTRIMKSLATLGHAAVAAAWLDTLESIYAEHPEVIGATTLRYWQSAIDV